MMTKIVDNLMFERFLKNKKFQKQQEERSIRLKRMKEFNAPKVIIEEQEMFLKMSLAEYEAYQQKEKQKFEEEKREHIKNNPIKQSIIDEIYNRESELKYNSADYNDDTLLIYAINPLDFMSYYDYEYGVYSEHIARAMEIYRDRFKERYESEQGPDIFS